MKPIQSVDTSETERELQIFENACVPHYTAGHEPTEWIWITKDGWPLETFKGRPITNFIRRLLHGDHKECKQCYEARKGIKIA